MNRTSSLVALALLSLVSVTVGCDDQDKKKADLLAKTSGDAATTAASAVGSTVAPALAASSAAPVAAKPPKECPAGSEIVLDDADLEAELRLKLSKPKEKGAITAADLASVKSINLTKKKELNELDPCLFPKMTGLKHLYLGPGKLNDLKPIAALTQLESLRASINEVSDLKPLEKLTLLDRVDLGRTQVQDLAPLANLVNLTELELDDTPIADLAPLAKLKKLEMLSIKNTRVTDVSPLKDLPKLKQLRVQGTAVSNLDTLSAQTARGMKVVTK